MRTFVRRLEFRGNVGAYLFQLLLPTASLLLTPFPTIADSPRGLPDLPPKLSRWIEDLESNPEKRQLAVGQLFMIGTRSDWQNAYPQQMRDLIRKLRPGGYILHDYNYLNNTGSPKAQRAASHSLHRGLHFMSTESCDSWCPRLPPFIAADFEGTGGWGSSLVGSGLVTPPSALTVAAAQDEKLAEKLGALIGQQLRLSGINMLLGPVVDIDRQDHQTTAQTLQRNWTPRRYGSFASTVTAAAGQYLVGLRSSGIHTVLKHFPGLGNHDVNLHDPERIPQLIFDASTDLAPFRMLTKFSTGLMTSHVSIDDDVVTFSSAWVEGLVRGKGQVSSEALRPLSDGSVLLITDDLSDMPPLLKYKERHGKKWADLALDAFRAGHDILLFAHLKGNGAPNAPTEIDLLEARDRISQSIEGNSFLRDRFYDSLRRILAAKWAYWKNLGLKEKDLIAGRIDFPSQRQDVDTTGVILRGEHIRLNERFLREIHEQAFTLLRGEPLEDLAATKRAVFVPERYLRHFSGLKDDERISLYPLADSYTRRTRDSQWSEFISVLRDPQFDRVIVVPSVVEHYHMLDNASLYARDELRKAVVLVHSNPKNISREVALAATIAGTFSWHPTSFDVDVAFILGDLQPKSGERFPISFVRTIPEMTPGRMLFPTGISPIEDPLLNTIDRLKQETSALRLEVEARDGAILEHLQAIDRLNTNRAELKAKLAAQQSMEFAVHVFWAAVVLASLISLHRQASTESGSSTGAMSYLYSVLFDSAKKNIPEGVQEAAGVAILGSIGLWLSLFPDSRFAWASAVAVLLGPTAVGFLRYRYLSFPSKGFARLLATYLFSRAKNPMVLLFVVAGLAVMFSIDTNGTFQEILDQAFRAFKKWLGY